MFYPILAKQVKYFKETEGGQEIMGQLFEDLVVKWGTIKAYEIAEEMAEEKAEEIAKEKAEEIAKEMAEEIAEEKAEEIAKEKALEEKKASARRMIARGKLTLEEIAEDSDLPIEAVRDLAGLQLA
jgi:hypothetical protein